VGIEPEEHDPSAGGLPFWPGWVFTGALVLYAVAMHHGMGPPTGGIAQHWYEPTTFLYRVDLISFAFDSSMRALGCLTLPAVLLAGGVFITGRSAVARAIALCCVVATLLFVFYGEFAPRPWEFFGWRGSAVLWLTAACVGFAAAAPFLAASWLRLTWPLRVAVYLPFAFGIVAFIRNATGTNPELRFAISPWPAVPVFGMEVGALFFVVGFSGVAIAMAGFAAAVGRTDRGAVGVRITALLLGLLVPVGLLALGGWLGMFPFELGAKTLFGVAALCAVAIAGAATLGAGEDGGALRRRARWIAVGTALAGGPLLAGQVLARADYCVTREHRAREIIDALDRYVEREFLYPDALQDLVAAGDIEEIPAPAIGFGFLRDARFRYQNFGTSFILEFPAPRWVECAYTPPYVDEDSADEAEGDEAFAGGDAPKTRPTE
jgi:MFS family permease